MALEATDLGVLAYSNGFTLWHYTTIDADVTTNDYFNGASHMLRAGDIIIANTDTDGTPATSFYGVASITAGDVTVTDLLA
ncbi:MAG: hypothetical protein AAF556_02865 [Pseudomonadota bacterium]